MKNLAASIHARLAQRRAKTGEDFNVLLVRFTLERLLYRLSRSQHREQFILKGAMLFALWEPALHRVTRDLDLLGFGHPTPERLADIFKELCRLEVEADGVDFDARSVVCEDIRAQDEYAGIRVKLRATIGKAIVPLQVDVGFGDALLGAIRLPNDAFKKNAGTEVTTDIVMLRKLRPGETPAGPEWKETASQANDVGEAFTINEYFAARPEMMLGQMRLTGGMYGGNEPTLEPDGRNLAEALVQAVEQLPQGVYEARSHKIAEPTLEESIPAPDFVKPNAYCLHDGMVCIREENVLRPLTDLSAEARSRIRQLIPVRDAVRDCLRSQMDGSAEERVVETRQQLNLVYDRFVGRFGPVNLRANQRAFDGDPDLPLLLSLEHYNDETKRATKATIFTERTIHHRQPVESVGTPKEALLVTLNEHGCVDLDHMADLLNKPVQEFLPDLKGVIFLNPQSNQWETDDQYLSGNVREKLSVADAASVTDPRFAENVEALKSVQPADLAATEIDVRLGAAWLPPEDVQQFTNELLNIPSGVEIGHIHALGAWHINPNWEARGATANTTDWGTDRYTALELIEDALNLKTPTVYDTVDKKPVVNAQATEAAREKQERIKEKFKEWVWTDDSRRERLCRLSVYNDMAQKLEKLGIPNSEIAFIQDYDSDVSKLTLFRDVRAGKVRVLFGSTQKMGSGTNVQERLIALHHLDAPWRPADVEQREGRILRQGNKNSVVQVFRYVTEGSFDAYMWQTLETKAKFIAQVMSGDMTIRRLEDLDSAALTYAEVKAIASGNPLVIEKAQVDAELIRLTRLRSAHAEEQYRIRTNLRRSHEDAEIFATRLANLRQDLGVRLDTSGDQFRIELDGQESNNRGIAGELIMRRAEKLKARFGDDINIGRFAGFDLFLRPGFNNTVEMVVRGSNSYGARVTDTALGTIRSLEATVQGFEERAERLEMDITDAHKRVKELGEKVGAKFEREDRFQELTRRQGEIEEKLDLTKNQAPSQVEAVSAGDDEQKISENQTQTHSPRRTRGAAVYV